MNTAMLLEPLAASEMGGVIRAIMAGADPAKLTAPIVARVLEEAASDAGPRERDEQARSLRDKGYYLVGSVAVLPVIGPIWEDGSGLMQWFGGTTMGRIAAAADQIAGDSRAQQVVLHLDTPGGTVQAFDALAALTRLGQAKRITALAAHTACSMGVWLACMADKIVTTPMGRVGSIGSRMGVLYDESERFEREGVRAIPLTTAKNKLTGFPGLPIDEEQVEALNAELEHINGFFIEAVSNARGMDPDTIRAMQGRCYRGTQGVEVGLVDRVVETAGELLEELSNGRAQSSNRRATAQHSSGAVTPSLRHSVTPSLSQEPAMAESKNGAGQAGTAPESSTPPATPAAASASAPIAHSPLPIAPSSGPASIEAIDAIAAKLPAEGGVRDAFVVACVRGKVTEAGASALLVESALGLYTKAQETITAQSKRIADLEALGDEGRGTAPVSDAGASVAGSGGAGGADGTGAYGQLVREKYAAEAGKKSVSLCMAEIAQSHPEAHEAWLIAGCPAITVRPMATA